MKEVFVWIIIGMSSIVWLYIVARVVTRAVLRTIEQKRNGG